MESLKLMYSFGALCGELVMKSQVSNHKSSQTSLPQKMLQLPTVVDKGRSSSSEIVHVSTVEKYDGRRQCLEGHHKSRRDQPGLTHSTKTMVLTREEILKHFTLQQFNMRNEFEVVKISYTSSPQGSIWYFEKGVAITYNNETGEVNMDPWTPPPEPEPDPTPDPEETRRKRRQMKREKVRDRKQKPEEEASSVSTGK